MTTLPPVPPLSSVDALPEAVRALARPQHFPRHDYVYRPGTTPEQIYVLQAGFLKAGRYSEAGVEVVYDVIGPKEFCGNLKYLGGGRFREFAKAVTAVEALSFDLKRFKALFRSEPTVHDWFVRLMVSRWARTEERLYRNTALPAERRLTSLLEELRAQGLDARANLTQSDLAQLTGVTRQTVAKAMGQVLKGEG